MSINKVRFGIMMFIFGAILVIPPMTYAHDDPPDTPTTPSCEVEENCTDDIQPVPHTHEVLGITATYDDTTSHDTQYALQGPGTLTHSFSDSWSHSWNATIGFSKDVINGAVGYNVGHSETETWSFTFAVAAGETRQVYYEDSFHVTEMDIRTVYGCPFPLPTCAPVVEEGQATAKEWFLRVYKSKVI